MSQRFIITHTPVQKLTFNEAVEKVLAGEEIVSQQVIIPKVHINTNFKEFLRLLENKDHLNKLLRILSNNLYPNLPAEFGYVINLMKDSLLQLSPEDYLVLNDIEIINAFEKLLQ